MGLVVSWCDVVIQDQMLSTAQQMLQDSRSKIELIRLQIIKVTQAGSSSGGGGIGGDGGCNLDRSTRGGQSPGLRPTYRVIRSQDIFFMYTDCLILETCLLFCKISDITSHKASSSNKTNLKEA